MTDSHPNESWRVFVAIDIPGPVRKQIQDHVRRLREAVPEALASWTRAENIHLTLKFLGDTAGSRILKLSEAVSLAAHSCKPFTVHVTGTGVFPNHRAPKVLWIGLTDRGHNLQQLQKQLEVECELKGFPKEERAFRPHLTVARLRHRGSSPTVREGVQRRFPKSNAESSLPHGPATAPAQHARNLALAHEQMEFKPVEFTVSEILLIRSELSSQGSKYTTLSRHHLVG